MSNMSAYPSVKSPCTELSSEASFDNNKGIASGFTLFVFSSFQPNSVQTEKHHSVMMLQHKKGQLLSMTARELALEIREWSCSLSSS